MLRSVSLKSHYTSEADNLYSDFFIPALSASRVYRRAVGFFSLGVLLNAPSALSRIVESAGKVELIFGKLVSAQDFEAIRAGLADPRQDLDCPDFASVVANQAGSLLEYRIRLLAWLFSNGRLEIKIAVRPQGLFHQKIGILEDRVGDVISFSGSMNETMSALDPRFNSEEITVFKSWNAGQKEYVDNHKESFSRLWSGDTGSSTVVCAIPEALEAGLRLVSEKFPDAPTAQNEDDRVRTFFEAQLLGKRSLPRVPDTLNGHAFEMREHQMRALRAWAGNAYNGILELATGAGKTITAIYAATKTFEGNDGIVLIVAVPYQDLADQWCDELQLFGINALRCYGARGEWEPALQAYLRRNHGQQVESLAIVVVNRTLKTAHFQNYARDFDLSRIFFIGDECHHHGAEGFVGKLLPGSQFRIGLSATPFHYLDEERNARLRSVYDKVVYSYTLADAVRDKVLTPYEYHPIPVELTDAEAVDYVELSDQIARLFAAEQNKKSPGTDQRLTALLMRRARLVGAASNKLPALDALLDERGEVEPYSLFYCSDGRTLLDQDELDTTADFSDEATKKQRHAVAQMLQRRGVSVSPFTSDENRWQRRQILRRFKNGETSALVAIRCLDEGIDVPACRTAYLIASSRNPRQFVQRRGRILRRAEGKEFARIFDFVVVLPESSVAPKETAGDFLKNELGRVADFARNSLYPASSVAPLMPWLKRFDLEYLAS